MRTHRFRIYEIPTIEDDGDRLRLRVHAYPVGARGGEKDCVVLVLTLCSWEGLAEFVVTIRQEFLKHKGDVERQLARVANLIGRSE